MNETINVIIIVASIIAKKGLYNKRGETMNDLQKETVSVLNHLIEICEDGCQGYRQAAEHIDHPGLSRTFSKYSQQRAEYAAELRDQVRRMGGEPEDGGTVTGALHRGWTSLKTALAGDNLESVVTECEREEDRVLEEYKDALEKQLPTDARALVEKQYYGVKEGHDEMRSLEVRLES